MLIIPNSNSSTVDISSQICVNILINFFIHSYLIVQLNQVNDMDIET